MGPDRLFPAKLMLFGEYTVINGSSALAIPLETFYGKWVEDQQLNNWPFDMRSFLVYLKEYNESLNLDLISLEEDLRRGIRFESSIPTGFGLGSSGSFVAGLYDRYARSHDTDNLKDSLATIESFFHGKSSGLDPLVSYQRAPYLIKNGVPTMLHRDLSFNSELWSIWLINSTIARRTEPLVVKFKEMLQNADFADTLNTDLIPKVDSIIELFLSDEVGHQIVWDLWSGISNFQFEHFKPMIIDPIKEIWQKGIQTDNFKLKLCGAGGGGFYLALVKNNGLSHFKKSIGSLDAMHI